MTPRSRIPALRIRKVNDAPVTNGGDFVLYWMMSNRRADWNFALQRAVEWALHLRRPLLVFEPLRLDYPWASARLHRFILDGMAENWRRFDGAGVAYYPFVATRSGDDRRVFADLAERAAVVVADDNPMFFYPAMLRAAGAQLNVRLEAVDAAGLLPVRATEGAFPTAHAFRRVLQKALPEHLRAFPVADPCGDAVLPGPPPGLDGLAAGLPPTPLRDLEDPSFLATLAVQQAVPPLAITGGSGAGRERLERFVECLLPGYAARRNHPEDDHTSGLSPYLHFGHVSPHEVFTAIATAERWSPTRLAASPARGSRTGWWGVSENAEAFLDQLVTWRELGLNMCTHRNDYDAYGSLPPWALQTLDEHRADERPYRYELADFEAAATHDDIWNAAQTQLVREGRIHNYLRMLWGKKILEWSASPEAALATMIELNNKYALDGRDPNSYSGIFWTLGRYDRPWGPERQVFGKVRYMTSANTARKLRFGTYLQRFAAGHESLHEQHEQRPC